jgi:hypothetical protein
VTGLYKSVTKILLLGYKRTGIHEKSMRFPRDLLYLR